MSVQLDPEMSHAVQSEPKRQRQDSCDNSSVDGSLRSRQDGEARPKGASEFCSREENSNAQKDQTFRVAKDRESELVAEVCAAYLIEKGSKGLLPFPMPEVSESIAKQAGVKNTQVERFVVRHLREARTPGRLYLMFHKPAGYSSMRTPGSTVYALLAQLGLPPLPHVGRLDKQTEGLLLFTDDGMLLHALSDGSEELPVDPEGNIQGHGHVSKTYRALVDVPIACCCPGPTQLMLNSAAVEGLSTPLEYEPGRFTTPAQDVLVVGTEEKSGQRADTSTLQATATSSGSNKCEAVLSGQSAQSEQIEAENAEKDGCTSSRGTMSKAVRERRHVLLWVQLSITEGKKHQVRKLFGRAGMRVKRLVRIAFGGLELGDLGLGNARSLTNEEVALCYSVTGLQIPPNVLPLEPIGT